MAAAARTWGRGLTAVAAMTWCCGAAAFSSFPAQLAGTSFLSRACLPGLAHVASGRPSLLAPGGGGTTGCVLRQAGRRVRRTEGVRGVDIGLRESLWGLGAGKGDAGLGADLLLTDLFVVGGLVVAAAKAFESRLKFRLGISSVLPSTRVHACVDADAVIRIMFSLSSSSQRSVFALFACVRTHPHASRA